MKYDLVQDGDQWALELLGFSTMKEAEKYYKENIEKRWAFIVEMKIGRIWGSCEHFRGEEGAKEYVDSMVNEHGNKRENLRIVIQLLY